ncbi:MAG: DUF342 domain-containing protein, partial [Desulfamplus sp.]|nr:DUF342 domain-containing protein [Desulfamplus sp.]
LAQKIPLILPVKGSTVTGIEIPAPTPVDVTLSCGKGAVISKDGLTVTAAVNGRPDLAIGGRISVMHEKVVEGNVDFKTGNIIFGGDVSVNGTLLPGFSVTADNLTVNDINEGLVNVENNIIVKNNIINADIHSGGNLLVAQSMKKSKVSARGDVVIQNEIIDCNIVTSGKVVVTKGRIISSTIHAAKGIESKDIGSETSEPCNLFPGADDYANDSIRKFNIQINSEQQRLEELEAAQKEFEKKIFEQLNALADMSKIQEGLLAEKQSILIKKNAALSETEKKNIDERISELEKNISKIDNTVNKLFSAYEGNQTKAKSIALRIKSVNNQIDEIVKAKSEFQKWYEDQQKESLKKKLAPGVIVYGTLYMGTLIKATHCAIKVKEDIRSSKIYQTINNTNPDKPFYEMTINPISSRRR